MFKLILLIVLLVIVAFFSAENSDKTVHLSIFNYSLGDLHAVVLIFISVILGILLTLPIVIKQRYFYYKKIRHQSKECKNLKKEVKKLTSDQPKLLTHDNHPST
ncbi:MAG TPA: LapA family protein [Spirochaetes bacterium]|nr:LapA family protein [Spirochaetota bacterium]